MKCAIFAIFLSFNALASKLLFIICILISQMLFCLFQALTHKDTQTLFATWLCASPFLVDALTYL